MDCKVRRRFLQQLGTGIVLPTLGPAAAWAGNSPLQVKATATSLSSDSERMISYRNQQHLVQSSDGALHLLVNRGSLTPGPGLSLFSSFDGGTTWVLMQNFSGTDTNSTGDVLLVGDTLSLVFGDASGVIRFAQLQYSRDSASWALLTLEVVYADPKWFGLNPALAIDDLGTVWVGLCSTKGTLGLLRVVCRPAGGVWTDPGLSFGAKSTPAVQRSVRPVRLAGAVGMVWTNDVSTYWSTRSNSLAYGKAWTQSTIYVGSSTKAIVDPYASHFNLSTDPQGGVHLISVESYDVLYFHYDPVANQWSAPQQVDDSRNVAYAQLGVVNGKVAVAFSVQRGAGELTVSPDSGLSWAPYADLQLISAYPGINYNTARVEMPVNCTGSLPILQQYSDSISQKLMLFTVPAP